MDVTTLRLYVKQEYLRIIAGLIETGALDLESAKEPTKQFQTFVNVTTVEDLKKNIREFSENYPLFGNLNAFLLRKLDEIEINELKQKMETQFTNLPQTT